MNLLVKYQGEIVNLSGCSRIRVVDGKLVGYVVVPILKSGSFNTTKVSDEVKESYYTLFNLKTKEVSTSALDAFVQAVVSRQPVFDLDEWLKLR